MSKCVKKQAPLLIYLAKAKPAVVKAIINTGDKELINALCECALNVLSGNVPLTKTQKTRLCRHKTGLREISRKNTSLKKKKETLQRGGFLGALLSPILGILGGLLGER